MAKQKFKITNWSAYNNALSQRGSLTVWLDDSAIAAWTDSAQPEGHGQPLHYTDMDITTILMMQRVFNLSLRRAKTLDINIKTPTRSEISHLVIDAPGLKVFGEGEWKVRQHGADRCGVSCKLHLATDSATHEIICADLSLSGTTDAQALPGLINQTHRKIREVSADGAYDTHYCHDPLLRTKVRLSHREAVRNTSAISTMSVTTPCRISI